MIKNNFYLGSDDHHGHGHGHGHGLEEKEENKNGYDKPRREVSQSDSNSSVDDEFGHYNAKAGDRIDRGRYEVKRLLGKGTFGKVYLCKDSKRNDIIAIKVVRKVTRYVESALIEARILDNIYDKQKAGGVNYFAKMYSHWKSDGYYFLVFEKLGISLYDLVKQNKYMRMSLPTLQTVAKQLLEALSFMKAAINLIHTDLKMENILFTGGIMTTETVKKNGKEHEVYVPIDTRIKLIDFGGATYDDERKSTIINTRQYRGPEVTLETGWSFPSDCWSAGCIIAELYSGDLLFQTHDELEHLALIEKTVGRFPSSMVSSSRHGRKYFHSDNRVRIGNLRDSESSTHVSSQGHILSHFHLDPPDRRCGLPELVRALLGVDPRDRATARQALDMQFFRERLE